MTELLHHGHQATGAMLADFKKLVAWVHSHADICCHTPNVESVSGRENDQNYTVFWQCESGHAYRWPFNHFTESNSENKVSDNVNAKRKRSLTQACAHVQESPMKKNELFDSDDSVSSLLTHISGEQGYEPKSRTNQYSPELYSAVSNPNTNVRETNEKVRYSYQWVTATERPSGFNPNITSASVSMDSQDRNRKVCSTSDLEKSEGDISASNGEDPPLSGCTEAMNSDDSPSEDEQWNSSKIDITEAFDSPQRLYRTPPKEVGPVSEVYVPGLAAVLPSSVERQPLQKREKTDLPGNENLDKRQLNRTARRPSNIANFQSWISHHRPELSPSLSSLSAEQLDSLLTSYFQQQWMSGPQGPSSRAVLCCGHTIERYLQSQGCVFSLAKSVELGGARAALHACVREARSCELTRHLDILLSVQHGEKEELRGSGALGRHSPRALLNLVLLNNLHAFGKQHLQGPTPPRFGHFHLARGPGNRPGLEYLEWRVGTGGEAFRMHGLPANPARCPLQDFRLYVSKHNRGFPREDDALYSAPRAHPCASGWYTRAPGNLKKMVRDLSQLLQNIRALRQSSSNAE